MFKKHPLFILYLFIVGLVLVGLCYSSGLKHIFKIVVYLFVFIGVYFFLNTKIGLPKKERMPDWLTVKQNHQKAACYTLLVFIIGFIVLHLSFLGHVPFITAWKSLDYYHIASVRQSINELNNPVINYLSAFVIRGFIPFLLLCFFIIDKRCFYILLPVALFYALSLMQKGLVACALIPLIIYTLINKSFLKAALFSFISFAGVYLLVYIANPKMKATQDDINAEMKKNGSLYKEDDKKFDGSSTSAVSKIFERVFVTTGKVAGYWFDKIPLEYPYAKGCGYRFLSPLLGCDFNNFDYSHIIYNATYTKESKMGFKGTVTAANFVYDYANFGYIGLAYSAFILALFFFFLQHLFSHSFKWIISINGLFVIWLSSVAFHTLLFSGGWLISIFLFLIFKNLLLVKTSDEN